jgi:hypothetical protein
VATFLQLFLDNGDPYTVDGKPLEQSEDGKSYRLDGRVYEIDPLVMNGVRWASGSRSGNLLMATFARIQIPPTSPEMAARYAIKAPGAIKMGRWWIAISDANKAGAIIEPERTNVIEESLERTAAEEHAKTMKAKKIVGIVATVAAGVIAAAVIKKVTAAKATSTVQPSSSVLKDIAQPIIESGKQAAAAAVTTALAAHQAAQTPEQQIIQIDQAPASNAGLWAVGGAVAIGALVFAGKAMSR